MIGEWRKFSKARDPNPGAGGDGNPDRMDGWMNGWMDDWMID